MPGYTPVTFSLNFCAVNLANLPAVTGFAEGDALNLEYPNDDFERQESSDGLVIWVQKHNTVVEGVLRLGQGNYLVALIRTLHEASKAAGGLLYPFSAKNLKSPDELAAGQMMIKKGPPIKWSDTAQPVEINFDLQASVFAGGTLLPV
jgi:hypothetical protein